jgi:hypothetical protein
VIGGRNRWSPLPRNDLKSHRKEGRKERRTEGKDIREGRKEEYLNNLIQ